MRSLPWASGAANRRLLFGQQRARPARRGPLSFFEEGQLWEALCLLKSSALAAQSALSDSPRPPEVLLSVTWTQHVEDRRQQPHPPAFPLA